MAFFDPFFPFYLYSVVDTIHLKSQQCLLLSLSWKFSFFFDVFFSTHFNFPSFFFRQNYQMLLKFIYSLEQVYSLTFPLKRGHFISYEQPILTFGLRSSKCTALVCVRIFTLAVMVNAAKGIQLSMGKRPWSILVRHRLTFEIKVYPGRPSDSQSH